MIMIFTAAVSALTVILGGIGAAVICGAQYKEVQTVLHIAGGVLSEYPQIENTFVTAVMDNDRENMEYGKNIMSHYGYDGDMKLNARYRESMAAYLIVLAFLFAAELGCGYAAFAYIRKRQKDQEENLLAVLDDCLSGDYGFIEDEQRLHSLGNPVFADAIVKLAESLQLKTEYLNAEQDNTKTLVTDISHQLKTPISSMKACFSMYLEADSEKERSEFLMRSRIQMDKLESLAAALIDISRLEYGMIILKRTDTLLAEILVGALNTVYHKALKKNLDIVTAEFEDIRLKLDPKWTAEAIANVLDNAVKYSPGGSGIQIRVWKLYSFVRIEIEDNGIGIPKKEQNKIFRRFYRGEDEMVNHEEGSGVGLYLARKILEEQGGTISVHSVEGEGSTFVIQLPL